MRSFSVFLILFGTLLISPQISFGQALVEIEKSISSPTLWLNSTASLSGAKPTSSPTVVNEGQYVLLALAIKLDFSALVYLRTHGQLPLYEVWVTSGDQERVFVGISPEKWVSEKDAIESDFNENGYVLWPTYGGKQNLTTGQYKVEFRDANSRPVKLAGADPIISEINVNVTPNTNAK